MKIIPISKIKKARLSGESRLRCPNLSDVDGNFACESRVGVRNLQEVNTGGKMGGRDRCGRRTFMPLASCCVEESGRGVFRAFTDYCNACIINCEGIWLIVYRLCGLRWVSD